MTLFIRGPGPWARPVLQRPPGLAPRPTAAFSLSMRLRTSSHADEQALKVLEDRIVLLESAYFTENDPNIPQHIHDIFVNGLPADFRLVATTRMPGEIAPALRSRCMEIFFKPLDKEDIRRIALGAVAKIQFEIDEEALNEIIRYAGNGREAVNIVQLAAGIAQMDKSNRIVLNTVEKVLNNGRFSPRPEVKLKPAPTVGVVNGLAVYGANVGTLIEVECNCIAVDGGQGQWTATGVIEQEVTGERAKIQPQEHAAVRWKRIDGFAGPVWA